MGKPDSYKYLGMCLDEGHRRMNEHEKYSNRNAAVMKSKVVWNMNRSVIRKAAMALG